MSDEVPARYEIRFRDGETAFATSLDEAREIVSGRAAATDVPSSDVFPVEIWKAGISDPAGAGDLYETITGH